MPVYAPLNAHNLLHHDVTKERQSTKCDLSSISVPHYVHLVSHPRCTKSFPSIVEAQEPNQSAFFQYASRRHALTHQGRKSVWTPTSTNAPLYLTNKAFGRKEDP